MIKKIQAQVVFGVLIALIVLTASGSAAAQPNLAKQRIIAHTTTRSDRTHFKSQGCTIIHELNDATALSCPEDVQISNSEPDTVLHILDLTSDAQIKANQVWSLTPGYDGTGTTVAVLDTGIDYNHLQLSSSSASADPANGHCFAVTAGDCSNGFFDDNGHGTHVSGIITSDGLTDPNNANGASSKGVAPGASVWMAKVCDAVGNCYTSDIAAAIQYVVNNQIAKVMSISLGGGGTTAANCDSDYLASQINWAYTNGVVAVVAAGNSGNKTVGSPACASKAIAVAAVDSSDALAYFSSFGSAVKDHGVAAPGVNIYSTLPANSYASWSGTSMATPHVSATVALMLSKNPGLTPSAIRSTIFSSADCLKNKYGACPNASIGYGRIDALRAVSPALSMSASPSAITTAQTSTITVSTSDRSDTTVTFSANMGTLSASSCTTAGGSCTVAFSSTTAGTATITGSANGYISGSTSVTVSPVPYSATFSQSGIPGGVRWGVTVKSTRYTSTSSSVNVSGLSGTVSYAFDSSVRSMAGKNYICSAGCSGTATSTDNIKSATYKIQSR